jgi:hypothetical protein
MPSWSDPQGPLWLRHLGFRQKFSLTCLELDDICCNARRSRAAEVKSVGVRTRFFRRRFGSFRPLQESGRSGCDATAGDAIELAICQSDRPACISDVCQAKQSADLRLLNASML